MIEVQLFSEVSLVRVVERGTGVAFSGTVSRRSAAFVRDQLLYVVVSLVVFF